MSSQNTADTSNKSVGPMLKSVSLESAAMRSVTVSPGSDCKAIIPYRLGLLGT